MKKLLPLFLILIFQIAGAENNLTVKEQLVSLNRYWLYNDVDASVLQEKIPLDDDISLIQMHLSLVENHLRAKDVSHLSSIQREKRAWCLDILRAYYLNGVFPKNTGHKTRTPYFIDNYGTACAVGQLIISTGYENTAQKIHAENNYAYISELNSIYPQLKQWADEYGFEMDELAWIQPCYCSASGPATINVSCHGGYDGYFVPEASNIAQPHTYNGWYKWNGTTWDGLMCGGCDLVAGYYKCVVLDGIGASHDFFATITEPAGIDISMTVTNDNGTCNGSATATINGGVPGYSCLWSPGGFTDPAITDLCANTYIITVTDNSGCITTAPAEISFISAVHELSQPGINIFPNPSSGKINITLPPDAGTVKEYMLLDITGNRIVVSQHTAIDVSALSNGIYYVLAETENGIFRQRFMKE